jgi:tRNA(fMet)-specific endonuclease VapC
VTTRYLLDTNMVSYIVKGRSPAASARLLALEPHEVACVSAITEAEIRYGLARRPDATTLAALIEAFLASIRVLSWGRDEARAYGQVRAALESRGLSLGNMDIMIAAHAIAAGATLVTNDNHFSHIGDLGSIANWATDIGARK